MNIKKLIVAIIIIIFLYGGNIIYFQMQQLSEPLFLDHYYDFELNPDGSGYIDFYYVENKSDQTTIWSIEIPNVDYATINSEIVHQEFSHYQVKKVQVELNGENVDKDTIIDKIGVQFSNQDYKEYSIGEIIISPSTYLEGDSPVQFLAGGSSNNLTNFIVFEANEKLKMLDITHAFKNSLGDQFYILFDHNSEQLEDLKNKLQSKTDEEHEKLHELLWQENENDIKNVTFPIQFEKGDIVKLNSGFDASQMPNLRNTAYQFELKLIFETDSGVKVIARDHINHQPLLTKSDVLQLEKKVGENNE